MSRDLHDMRVLVHGDKGVGTSTLARGLAEDVVFLSVNNDGWKRVPAATGANCSNWVDFVAACTIVADNPKEGRVLVIDGLEQAYQAMRESVLTANGWRVESDGAYALGKETVADAWRKWYRILLRSGGHVLLCHSQLKEIASTTRSYTKQEPQLTPAAWQEIQPHLDAVVCAQYETVTETGQTDRVALLSGREDIVAASGSQVTKSLLQPAAVAAHLCDYPF